MEGLEKRIKDKKGRSREMEGIEGLPLIGGTTEENKE